MAIRESQATTFHAARQHARRQGRRSRRLRLMFEPLEDRRLLAAAFGYDWAGNGGTVPDTYVPNAQTFDWKPDNALVVGGNTALQNFLTYGPQDPLHPVTYYTLAQADLGTLIDNHSNAVSIPELGTSRQVTFVARFSEAVTGACIGPDSISVQSSAAPGDNYVEIFADKATNVVSPRAGTGYNSGTRILAATVDTLFSTFSQGLNTGFGILDNHGANTYNGALNSPGPALYSMTGVGSVVFAATINFVDNNYFPDLQPGVSVKWTTNAAANLVVPFNQVDPAARFLTSTTTTAVGAAAILAGAGNPFDPVFGIGEVNAVPLDQGGGPCVQEQHDASSTFDRTVSLGDYVWVDSNGDGAQGATETGLNGVTVKLVNLFGQPVLINGQPAATVTAHNPATNADGYYQFGLLPPATYRVQFVLPSGYAFSKRLLGGDPTKDSNPDPQTGLSNPVSLPVALPSGRQQFDDATIAAGLYVPVVIGDFVWSDLNANGIQDDGEPGIPHVALTLTGTSGSGETVTDQATTDLSGHYQFVEAPGTYTLIVDANNLNPGGVLAGLIPTLAKHGSDRSLDSNPPSSGTTPTTLLSGGSDATLDFGEARAAFAQYQNSTLCEDVNHDGVVSPIDALIVINFVNLGQPLPPAPVPPAQPEYYWDVDGNNLATASDVVHIIHRLDGPGSAGGEGESEVAAMQATVTAAPAILAPTSLPQVSICPPSPDGQSTMLGLGAPAANFPAGQPADPPPQCAEAASPLSVNANSAALFDLLESAGGRLSDWAWDDGLSDIAESRATLLPD